MRRLLVIAVLLGSAVPLAAPPARADDRPLSERMAAEPDAWKALVDAARDYFDLDVQMWKGRKGLVETLARHAEQGEHVLTDMDALRWLVYQGRSFKAGLRRADVPFHYALPKAHPSLLRLRRDFPRADPVPLLVVLHDPGETGGAALQRCYQPADPRWRALRARWALLAPTAGPDGFVGPDGLLGPEFRTAMATFWKHSHVDFDRFVLDGALAALPIASAWAVFFGGIVLRGDGRLDAAQSGDVVNFAPVPVYVVGNPELAADLRTAGHPEVTAGDGQESLVGWLDARRRRPPLSFSWNARRLDQVLPYWVNLDAVDWDAPERSMELRVDAEENVIHIRALGLEDLTLFLNDEIVDLDRRVRVEINGHVEHDEIPNVPKGRLVPLRRDLDVLFNREPVRIRTSMYYGWLTPARIVRLLVREPREVVPTPAREPVQPDPDSPSEAYPPVEAAQELAFWLLALVSLAILAMLGLLLYAMRRHRR